MTKKLDLRIQKTYHALTTTFLDLLKNKAFEEITVQEICDKALIRRATFYKHFSDKYDFSIFVIRELEHHFFETSDQEAYIPPHTPNYYINVARKAIAFSSENKTLLRSILLSNSNTLLIDVLSEEIVQYFIVKLKNDLSKGTPLPATPEILAHYYTGSFIQVLRWWIMQSQAISEEELLDQLISIWLNAPTLN